MGRGLIKPITFCAAMISLAPGLQPGEGRAAGATAVSTAFPSGGEAAEAAESTCASKATGLKPGANEKFRFSQF
jgi:hypothetical protein